MKKQFEMLADYNAWVNRRLYDAAAKLSDTDYRSDHGAFFGSLQPKDCSERRPQMSISQHGTGLSLARFLKATIAGGLLFLLPLILVVVLLAHAMRLARKVAQPMSVS